MAELKGTDPVATLIGDVVASRAAGDRARLHGRLSDLVRAANAQLNPLVPLRITVGDEYQGCFATVGEAVHATLWLGLHLAPDAQLRHGVGWGSVAVLAEAPRVEDGPGWWAAREAIDEVKQLADKPATRHLRTAFRRASGSDGPDPNPVNAALMCRDQMVGSVSERSLRLLRGTVDGRTQTELADDEGISASAVSQRVRRDGLAVIVTADELLRRAQ
jgi:SatD family (SatD)